jgi:plasmid stabilization system protein ParE
LVDDLAHQQRTECEPSEHLDLSRGKREQHEKGNASGGIVAATRPPIEFPASGRTGRIARTRELVINGTPYVAAYAVTEITVRILRVLHGAQEWPENLPAS